ncbi:MAG: acetolactate synthase [Gammaproteobacteria bacterium]|nr:acetolactate synthase [Gammaproteobacteria bacterium]|tara:strand:+ start:157 stop:1923 length:1767 start_codon:yes stop_codon:yes gene_type:complete
MYTASDYIVDFLLSKNINQAFVVTGGACAFVVDAMGRNKEFTYTSFHHEQSASMAADAVYRVENSKIGVTVATSGPGATNLITGIACSYFDSIPSIHITGQVNSKESSKYLEANVRQAGFQETDIVRMVEPITKAAKKVEDFLDLKNTLEEFYLEAISGRMGPVLIDIPMDVQQEEVAKFTRKEVFTKKTDFNITKEHADKLNTFFKSSKRPLVLFGAGIGLSNSQDKVINWINSLNVPFVSSWNGMSYFDHCNKNYYGHIGVYGNRGSNNIIQNCDALLVLGSRLDNRQRGGNVDNFAPGAQKLVIDIDINELNKYDETYYVLNYDLSYIDDLTSNIYFNEVDQDWADFIETQKDKYLFKDLSTYHKENNSLSPYAVTEKIVNNLPEKSILIPECGANLCWVYQTMKIKDTKVFTSGGNSPMGYTIPATIGAKLANPESLVFGILGDGGFQMNIQELQTINYLNLDIKLFIYNNFGYGIIKQFQDTYMSSRYEASGLGYSQPNFEEVANLFGFEYRKIESLEDLCIDDLCSNQKIIFDIMLDPNTEIEPKTEMGRVINDQFPYQTDEEFEKNNYFFLKSSDYNRPTN